MRLWVRDSERRPDPAPVKTDDRVAMIVGSLGWLVALLLLLTLPGPLGPAGRDGWFPTCAIGLTLGLVGLLYAIRRRR